MFLNLMGKKWCDDMFGAIFLGLSKEFKISLIKMDGRSISEIKYNERMIDCLKIEHLASGTYETFAINGFMEWEICQACYNLFDAFIDEHIVVKRPMSDAKIHKKMCDEIARVLGIDNNVSLTPEYSISFAINDYSIEQRKRMIDFLLSVSGDLPDVFIDIDLSMCGPTQAERLGNLLLCVEAACIAED